MAQFVDLTLVALRAMTNREVLAVLRHSEYFEAVKESGPIDWVTWRRGRETVVLATHVHQESEGNSVAIVGFDSRRIDECETESSKYGLIGSLMDVGDTLWSSLSFDEGMLSPEDTGWMLYSAPDEALVRSPTWLPNHTFARWMGRELKRRVGRAVGMENWIPHYFPTAVVRPLPREGLLLIWNDSPEGYRRFLSEF